MFVSILSNCLSLLSKSILCANSTFCLNKAQLAISEQVVHLPKVTTHFLIAVLPNSCKMTLAV